MFTKLHGLRATSALLIVSLLTQNFVVPVQAASNNFGLVNIAVTDFHDTGFGAVTNLEITDEGFEIILVDDEDVQPNDTDESLSHETENNEKEEDGEEEYIYGEDEGHEDITQEYELPEIVFPITPELPILPTDIDFDLIEIIGSGSFAPLVFTMPTNHQPFEIINNSPQPLTDVVISFNSVETGLPPVFYIYRSLSTWHDHTPYNPTNQVPAIGGATANISNVRIAPVALLSAGYHSDYMIIRGTLGAALYEVRVYLSINILPHNGGISDITHHDFGNWPFGFEVNLNTTNNAATTSINTTFGPRQILLRTDTFGAPIWNVTPDRINFDMGDYSPFVINRGLSTGVLITNAFTDTTTITSPGATTFSNNIRVAPREGLSLGHHTDTLRIVGDGGIEIAVSFEITIYDSYASDAIRDAVRIEVPSSPHDPFPDRYEGFPLSIAI